MRHKINYIIKYALFFHKPHDYNRPLIKEDQGHGNGRLGNHIRRRRYDAGKDEGTYNKEAPLLTKGLTGHQSQTRQDDQRQGQLKADGKRQHKGDEEGQIRR